MRLFITAFANRGPRKTKYTCGMCQLVVNNSDRALSRDSCGMWIHNRCSGISEQSYRRMMGHECVWICPFCALPTFSDSFFESGETVETNNRYDIMNSISADQPEPASPRHQHVGNSIHRRK